MVTSFKRGFKTLAEAEGLLKMLAHPDQYEITEVRAGGEFSWMTGEPIAFVVDHIGA